MAQVPLYHWACAEPTFLRRVCEQLQMEATSLTVTLPQLRRLTTFTTRMRQLRWYDLCQMCQHENLAIPGCLSFKLKHVAKALHALGEIEQQWEDDILDGLHAMQLAQQCYVREAQATTTASERRASRRFFQQIERYNEVDTQVLLDIIRFLQRRL